MDYQTLIDRVTPEMRRFLTTPSQSPRGYILGQLNLPDSAPWEEFSSADAMRQVMASIEAWKSSSREYFEKLRQRQRRKELSDEAARLAAARAEGGWSLSLYGLREQRKALLEAAKEWLSAENFARLLWENEIYERRARPEFSSDWAFSNTPREELRIMLKRPPASPTNPARGISSIWLKARRVGWRLSGFFGLSKVDARNNP